MNHLKKTFAKEIYDQLNELIDLDQIGSLVEQPKYKEQGDLAFPCFILAKHFKKAPQQIASEIADRLDHFLFEKVVAEGPYVNIFLNKAAVSQQVLKNVLTEQANYGSHSFGKGENIVFDMSSPNIAKPFSMGHLRSTVIGNALALIVEKCGYQAVKINHLGDWGTQFGKLIVAYNMWGDEKKVRANPIKELLQLYVKFHEEAEKDPKLEDEARAWFKKLEDGNEEARSLWKWFRDESLKEFTKIYDLLGVTFDSFNGEAFYNDKMGGVIELLEEKELLTESDGAEVVKLDEYDLPPSLIKKKDGATLYATRDLAAALYRHKEYQFKKAIYVVGHEQSLHFQQLFFVLQKLGFDWAKNMTHVPFGFILKDGKKMSTRKGKIVLLEEVIKEAIELAKKNIEEKNPELENKAEVAQKVGVGAIIFHDLKNERLNNVEFSLEDMLRFEGSTGPYVQYTYARACSILRKADVTVRTDNNGLSDEYSWEVVKELMQFPQVVKRSFEQLEPSQIAKYLLSLSQLFNKYYGQVKILSEDTEKISRLALVKAVTIVLEEGLRLLGIGAPEKM
ncbi:arginine--tRNA ligase [Bacillaceae bacterium W0354]